MRFDKLRKSLVIATLFAGIGATLSTGCAENRTSIFIYGVLAPPDDCKFQAGGDKALLFDGAYYFGYYDHYSVTFQVANQLTRMGDSAVLRPETSYFSVEGAEVNLLSGDGASTLKSYSVVTTTTIPPASGTLPGFAPVSVLVIPSDVARTLNDGDSVIAEVRIFGKSLGGSELQTAWSSFPIQVRQYPELCGAKSSRKECDTQLIACEVN